jgi:transcriptional regulator with XRE-family HTH domain
MPRNFKELRAKMPPESQARAHEKATLYRKGMALDELRQALDITQEGLANILSVNQSAISKIMRRTDMYISTLQSVVKAMGGDLRIEAVFPDGRVEINQFSKVRKAAG